MIPNPAKPAPAPAPPPSAPKVVYSGVDCTVTQTARGETTVLTFIGTCSPSVREWLPRGLRSAPGSLALKLRNLVMIDTPFVREILFVARDRAPRKQVVALIDPPDRVTETLEVLGAGDRVPVVSGEEVIPKTGSLLEHLQKDQRELAEMAAALETNPLWRRMDREQMWLCPFCGTLVEDVRILNMVKPGAAVARGVRRHLTERCIAWRAGNRSPLASNILDARLQQLNERKAASTAERTQILSRQVEGLQERVDSMEHLERDVRKAQRRQLHMLPVDPEPDATVDIAVVYRPAKAIGGDFLDFYSLPADRFGVMIGDVSGHGIEAAILMGMAKMVMRVRAIDEEGAREAMEHANRDLHGGLKSTAFVTAFYLVIDRATRHVQYARAGHPPPILRRAAGGHEELNSPGLPLGVDAGKRFCASLQTREADLAPGDILLFYTDGVIEAGYTANEFGVQRLRDALMAGPADATAEQILKSVVGTLDAFLAGAPQDDDVTLICLKVK